MEREKFAALLGLIVPNVIEAVSKELDMGEIEAAQAFYMSRVYGLLEDEDTKMWHFSPLLLAEMFCSEYKTGSFDVPEEG